MAITKGGINPFRQNIFNDQRFVAAKEIANACKRYSIKIELLNPQSRRVQVKGKQGNVFRKTTVRRQTIYLLIGKRQRY